MPSKSIDMIFTSPPYNVNLSKSTGDFKLEYDNYIDNLDYKEYCDNQINVLNECYRVLKDDGVLFYNHKDKIVDEEYRNPLIDIIIKTKFKIKQNIIWNRKQCINFKPNYFGNCYENIYFLYKKKINTIQMKHKILKDIWTIDVERHNEHPAPFPLELPLRAIYSIFDNEKNKTILDIYNGSGTTGVASLLLNHKYIGIDISEKYLEMSKKRLDNYMNESIKAQEEINKHIVEGKYSSKKITNQISLFD